MRRGFTPEGDFRSIHTENPRISAGGGERGDDGAAGQKTEFHQAAGDVLREVQAIEDSVLAGT